MNRLAAVLAADSATTVTSWTDSGRETRYFKGANKIFQLSDYEPVGVMIFASADLMSVPWEVIIKTFRQHLGKKKYNHVSEYADDFFSFISTDQNLFPSEVRKSKFLSTARGAVIGLLLEIIRDPDYDMSGQADPANNEVVARRHFESWKAEISAMLIGECFDDSEIAEAKKRWKDDFLESLELLPHFGDIAKIVDGEEITELAIEAVLKDPSSYFDETGLVFCGFGDKEIFPCAIEYQLCGVVDGKCVSTEVSKDRVDHDTPASIKAYAQKSMAETFMLGVSRDIYAILATKVDEGLREFGANALAEHGIADADTKDIELLIQAARSKIAQSVLASATQQHAVPLRKVIASLPLDEMAELAETLINLQSLKEKVTKPTETVGGPVDVAIITKFEGLVWIKRKHYFPGELNSRYAQRTNLLYK